MSLWVYKEAGNWARERQRKFAIRPFLKELHAGIHGTQILTAYGSPQEKDHPGGTPPGASLQRHTFLECP